MLLHTWLHCYFIPIINLHCTVLLYVQYIVKLCCLFSRWFAKEANVANNKQWLANEKRERYKCCKPGNYVMFSLEQVERTGVLYKWITPLVYFLPIPCIQNPTLRNTDINAINIFQISFA